MGVANADVLNHLVNSCSPYPLSGSALGFCCHYNKGYPYTLGPKRRREGQDYTVTASLHSGGICLIAGYVARRRGYHSNQLTFPVTCRDLSLTQRPASGEPLHQLLEEIERLLTEKQATILSHHLEKGRVKAENKLQ